MSERIAIRAKFKPSSAKNIEDLVSKAAAHNYQMVIDRTLSFYRDIVKPFNSGHDIVEFDRSAGTASIIDLFQEAAKASSRIEINWSMDKEAGDSIKQVFGSNNLSLIFMNAFYFFDRAIDTQRRGKYIATRDPETQTITPHLVSGVPIP